MNKFLIKLFSVMVIFALALAALPVQSVQAASTTIAQWSFESPNNPASATAATYPNSIAPAVGTGDAGGVHTSASTAWSTPTGNGSTYSFSSNNWSVDNYYQFSTSTLGYTGIQLSWDQTGSNTGPRDFKLAYSTDGTIFNDFGSSYSIANNTWSSSSTSLASNISRDLSSITAINNQANVYFRIIVTSTTSINGGTVATGGTDRVDNFTVSGTPIPATPTVDLSVSTNSATEAAATAITVTATSSSAVAGDQTVDLAVTGTDITTDDYTLSNTVITILDGQTTGSVTFTVVDDALIENTETAALTISNPSAGLSLGVTTSQSITIADNDTLVPTNPTGTGLATPANVAAGNSTLLTVAVIPGANPSSSGLAVTCDLSSIGGSTTQTLYDDGSNGDVTSADNTFSFQATVDSTTSVGAKSLSCPITDAEARSGSASIALTVLAYVPPAGSIVISQVYGGGGNSGATFKNDFVELYNRTANTIDLTGWSVQYASATGTSWAVTALSGSIAPGKYYLVQEAAGSGGTVNLPTPDATGTIAMSATAAKVALVNNSTALTGACPTGSNISDFVGFGTTASCYEGSGRAPAPSNTTSILRLSNGTQDTDNNNADFVAGTPNPRNSMFPFVAIGLATPANVLAGETTLLTATVTPGTDPVSTGITVSCNLGSIGGSATQVMYDDGTNGDQLAGDNIFSFATTDTAPGTQNLSCTFADAQGRSGTTTITLTLLTILPIGTVNGTVGDADNGTTHVSPYAGQTVLIEGVIYETTLQAISNSTNTYKGFFIQNTAATADADPNTSDGLFVFMSTASTISGPSGSYTPTVGDEVIISGTITEYYNMTELTSPTLVKPVVRSGVDIETEVAPVVANPPVSLADANRYWERLQGMRVQVPTNSIVLGGRNVFSPADAEIWVASPESTIAQRANPYARKAFRDAHPLDDNYDATNWDGNGYRILMGSLGIKAAAGDAQALIDPARAYSTVTNAPAGGLNYTFSKYRIEISSQPEFSEGPDPAANNPPTAFDRNLNYSIADYNLENLYDYRDNPFSGCDFTGNSGCPKVEPFLSAVTPPYDYVPASDEIYQARLNDIALEIINNLHSPDILMVQEVENQDICTVTGGALACGATDNADGKPDVLQELALKIAANGGPAYDAAFDRNSSDLRGIAPSFLYRTDRVELLPAAGDPVLGTSPAIGSYTAVPYNSDVSNPKTLNAILPSGVTACEISWVFPRALDIGLFRIYSTSIGVGSYRDVYVIDNHFKSGPDSCIPHRTEQAKYNAALVAFIQAANPNARIVLGGDLNVYPRPDDIAYGASDQLGSLYDSSLGLKNLWEVLADQAPEAAYSYVYLGQAQTLDQMFINQPMLADLKQYRIAHINSDFPAEYAGDVARGTSDHDPGVATFGINDAPTVEAGGPYTGNEGSSITLTATGADPEGLALTYAWDLDNNGSFETAGQIVTFNAVDGTNDYSVNVQVTDITGLTAVATAAIHVANVAPTLSAITAPTSPVLINKPVNTSATFTDPGVLDTHTALWDWGDGATSAGTVNETNGSGSVSGSHSYTKVGVYPVTLTLTDKDGGSASATYESVVIYNPKGGFVTGAGWLNSSVGRATFAVAAKYLKNMSVPTGAALFYFKAEDLQFVSTKYEWMVINSAGTAQIKGSGTVKGIGKCQFMIWATDGHPDTFRIKIWTVDSAGEHPIYDNGSDQPLGGGSISIQK